VTSRGKLSRAKILSAAAQVFGERGYHDASVSEITRIAGTAQGTFYVHFDSKFAIFEELVQSTNQLIRAEARRAIKTANGVLEAEEDQFRSLFKLIIDHPEIYRIIFEAEFVDRELSQQHYLSIARGWRSRLGPELGLDPSSIEAEAIVFCLFGVASYVGMRWPYWTGKPVPEQVVQVVMRFVEHGLGPLLPEAREPRKERSPAKAGPITAPKGSRRQP
jgi:AcrR family transcriptional regulator